MPFIHKSVRKKKTICNSVNHTRLPKDLLPDCARRDKQGTGGDRVKLGKALLIPFRDMYSLHFQDSRTGLPHLLQPK